MEVFENLCETTPDAAYDFAKRQMIPSVYGEINPEKAKQYSAALEVFEKLNRIAEGSNVDFFIRSPGKRRKNGSGSFVDKHDDVAFFSTDDPKFLKSLSNFFEKVDGVLISAYEENDTGNIRLSLDWSVKDVYL